MNRPEILLMFHCEQHTGYAIGRLEAVFEQAALKAGYSSADIYWSYPRIFAGNDEKILQCDYRNQHDCERLGEFLKQRNIKTVVAFDLGYPALVLGALKQYDIHIISYWGASMSSINRGVKLWLKKMEWSLRRNKPDLFVFESKAMQATATHGRGVPMSNTAVVYLGVDVERFSPQYERFFYAHELFDIDKSRKIIFYSGHMEERKGVRVIVQAAIQLFAQASAPNIHFLICGNKAGEADVYLDVLKGSAAEPFVTFAGYRDDVDLLMRSSSIGVIASTGWDSFTMSSVEMMSSGLPLIVSNLQGLAETVEDAASGFKIEPGNASELARRITELIQSDALRIQFSNTARSRALEHFSAQRQIEAMARLMRV